MMFLVLLILVWHINTSRKTPNQYALIITDDKMHDMNVLFLGTKLLEINPKLKCNHNK
jgi:hypothetical protein